MLEERYHRLMNGVRPKEALLNATLRAAEKGRINWRWAAAAVCAMLCVTAAAFWIALPPRDVVAANGEIAQNNGEFLPVETQYPCCDVRNMELRILSGSVQRGILFVEMELTGQGIHPEMVITVRMHDGEEVREAFHLLWDEAAHAKYGEGRITHLVSYRLDAASIPPEGKWLTLAVNNYDCGLDHDLYPHWDTEADWADVLPDCKTAAFKVYSDGTIGLMKD